MQEGRFSEIDGLGRRLSLEIGCSVRYSHEKGVFVCNCGVVFQTRALEEGDWEAIKRKHKEGK